MRPFRDGDTFGTFRTLIESTVGEIKALENEYVLKASPAELEQHYIGRVTLQPLVLHVEQRHIEDQQGVNIDVSGDIRRAVFPGERAFVRGCA
jgi:hypothetical protein